MTSVTKTVRLSGGSESSIEDAVSTVLARAAETIRDVQRFDIVEAGGSVASDGTVERYTVTLDIEFVVGDTAHLHG